MPIRSLSVYPDGEVVSCHRAVDGADVPAQKRTPLALRSDLSGFSSARALPRRARSRARPPPQPPFGAVPFAKGKLAKREEGRDSRHATRFTSVFNFIYH